ncbi:phosphate ABC transporter substrate-binding protein [Robiginitomaculum antarcticum]|uniref:phosphate ABC transporter substrate-binding protein n=1 Tax=Robiginitomaculum antarcticum TaxID=437507 RepID=UPI0014612E67|nr:phosphate ABC transporter substrate-binding protein [Robiginitomaculum antarcticum]
MRYIFRYGVHVAGVSFAAATILTACGGDGVKTAGDTVSISGSTTVLPAISRAADDYTMQTGAKIIVNAGGSGGGFKQLAEGQTDIGMMSRDITAEERARFARHSFTVTAIGRDAVAPAVSSEIYDAGVTQLSFEQVTDIYMGRVDNWSAFGGPDRAIFAVDKEAGRGTRQVFARIVFGDKNMQAPGADLVVGSNNEEQTALAQSDSAIGMISFAWANADVRPLSITTANGAVAPTLDNVNSGAFPITRDLLIVTREDVSGQAKAFIDFVLSPEGQTHVVDAGYLPVNK